MRKVDLKSLFGKAVRKQRGDLGISQEELAGQAGLHRTYISDIERGARNPSLESIERLAAALKVSLSTLFKYAGTPLEGEADPNSMEPSTDLVDIVFVEDNRHDIELTMHAFEKAKIANQVHILRDGVEALDYLFGTGAYPDRRTASLPHLILLDLGLPKIDGMEVLRRIKQNPRTQRIPVVVLTASEENNHMEECRRLGVKDYIVKPVSFSNLSEVTPQLSMQWGLLKKLSKDAAA